MKNGPSRSTISWYRASRRVQTSRISVERVLVALGAFAKMCNGQCGLPVFLLQQQGTGGNTTRAGKKINERAFAISRTVCATVRCKTDAVMYPTHCDRECPDLINPTSTQRSVHMCGFQPMAELLVTFETYVTISIHCCSIAILVWRIGHGHLLELCHTISIAVPLQF